MLANHTHGAAAHRPVGGDRGATGRMATTTTATIAAQASRPIRDQRMATIPTAGTTTTETRERPDTTNRRDTTVGLGETEPTTIRMATSIDTTVDELGTYGN